LSVHPFDTDYPDVWKEIVAKIRKRSGGRCECMGECGLHRGRRCVERDAERAIFARGQVMLTTAHRNHTPADGDLEKLFHTCQRCHLRYDRFFHRVRRLEAAGQQRLFDWHPD
jgi:hypothetical protein